MCAGKLWLLVYIDTRPGVENYFDTPCQKLHFFPRLPLNYEERHIETEVHNIL